MLTRIGIAFCEECDRNFRNEDDLQQHLRKSRKHAETYSCAKCNKKFHSDGSLQQHQKDSPRHVTLRVLSGASHVSSDNRVHPQDAFAIALPQYRTIQNSVYEGIPLDKVKAVYNVAHSLRRKSPSLDEIMNISGTSLDKSIVRAIWHAAERLNSLGESRKQAQLRAEFQKEISRRTQVAEDTFVQRIRSEGYQVVREDEIRLQAAAAGLQPISTPDLICNPPISIVGKSCGWLEYTSYFRFPDNPFVARSELKQLRQYVQHRGPGAVVYAFGFQCRHPNIDGVAVFRAAEFLKHLGSRVEAH